MRAIILAAGRGIRSASPSLTGGPATISGNVSFAQVAAACGYASSLETDAAARIGAWLDSPPLQGPLST